MLLIAFGLGALVCGIVILEEKYFLLSAGNEAPDFVVVSGAGEERHLRDYRGRNNVVLFFYPGDFTPGCTAEACSFRDDYFRVKEHDAIVFGVSSDNRQSHAQFAEAYHLPFMLVSDDDHTISHKYGTTWLFGLFPRSKRVTFIIDKQGVIRGVSHHELAIGRHSEDVMAILRQLN